MDYTKRNKIRMYSNKYNNHYTEDDNYPRRIIRPVAILLVVVLVLFYLIAWKLFTG